MHISRKAKVGALVTVVVLGIAGGAFAFFTNAGSGSGDATVGTSTGLTLTGDAPTALLPGESSIVNFTVANTSSSSQHLGSISLASVDTDDALCLPADFTMVAVPINRDFAAGASGSILETGILRMTNTAVNQDACKNSDLTLNLVSN